MESADVPLESPAVEEPSVKESSDTPTSSLSENVATLVESNPTGKSV